MNDPESEPVRAVHTAWSRVRALGSELHQKGQGPDDPQVLAAREALSLLYEAWGKLLEAGL